ncbi:hypothetical protein PROFUN_01398 [Planoprotostelium fungivorum]|uniref:Fido domain-containing protein n=1 Tax=Planoprotostelium fungivorum TaxID=1890364 RepID=A0A2P6NT62_9EUKA|nr:hypothetical protein PROFUN_01398 [Planoprotostelium fungivorum]
MLLLVCHLFGRVDLAEDCGNVYLSIHVDKDDRGVPHLLSLLGGYLIILRFTAMKAAALLLACVAICLSQSIHISSDWDVTQDQLDQWTATLPKTDKELWFFHWGSITDGLRMVKQQTIQMSGGGFYMSQDRYDTKSYGPFCTIAIVPVGTPIYRPDNLTILGRDFITPVMKSLLGLKVPFIHQFDDYSSNWWVTHNAKVLSHLVAGASQGIDTQLAGSEEQMWKNMDDLAQAASQSDSQSFKDSVSWLSSFYSLFYYMDSIALSRAVVVNPTNPWHEFEPEHFENFHIARKFLLEVMAGRKHVFVSDGGVFGNGQEKKAWAKNQTDVVIPQLWSMIAGTTVQQVSIRGGQVRAGGSDLPDHTFKCTEAEVKAMKKNPYLTVNATLTDDGDYEVFYYYPDVFNFHGVAKAGYLSLTTSAKLLALQTLFRNDTALQAKWNKILLEDLMQNLFERWHGRKIIDVQEIAKFMVEFVSIHPYEDYNGRTTRMYAHLACYESATGNSVQSLPHEYISDFDTVFPLEKYGRFMIDGGVQITSLMLQLQKELVDALAANRVPSYYNLPGWLDLTRSLKMFGLEGAYAYTVEDYKLIEHRQFTQLFDKIISPDWGKSLDQ